MKPSDMQPFYTTALSDGFWKQRVDKTCDVTLHAVYDRFEETHRFEALKHTWCEGMPNRPHIFYDSDVAKWIEGAAYCLMHKRDADIEEKIDGMVEDIAAAQQPDGYFNSFFTLIAPEMKFKNHPDHELYCLGHLLEAGIAYDIATGKDKLFKLMERYVDLVDRVFRVKKSAGFDTPGHEEIELALYRAYKHTGDDKFLTLMKYFLETRGKSERDNSAAFFGADDYAQTHLPVREQTTAEGHSVRAMYLYCAMADLAHETGDASLLAACETLFDNTSKKRMYITGGIGSTYAGESFTYDYDLMNRTAYAETCAAIGLMMFARRMYCMQPHSKYSDVAELAMYNGMLAGISLSGDAFFYENPLEAHPKHYHQNQRNVKYHEHSAPLIRQRVFSCSCCPPNILRVISSIADYAISSDDNTIYIHQYIAGQTRIGSDELIIDTQYPYDGKINITVNSEEKRRLALRIPGWVKKYSIFTGGAEANYDIKDGYAYLNLSGNTEIELNFDIEARCIAAHPAVHEDCGRIAVMRGPLVYCAEEKDNGANIKDITIFPEKGFTAERDDELNTIALSVPGSRRDWPEDKLYMDIDENPGERDITVKLIPYFTWANRGENEMAVWLQYKC